ncbi:hypothetical protein EVAR_14792_1 [Eumeta japonica]|uniref:Uncharacterized protein n=1 Tax=Eumeta variegata TaxID=151549 RepID=A0A4C1TWI7_EUMVA|nr:hypothetical protein EVAR_14792_1 [Eumeta japonica]
MPWHAGRWQGGGVGREMPARDPACTLAPTDHAVATQPPMLSLYRVDWTERLTTRVPWFAIIRFRSGNLANVESLITRCPLRRRHYFRDATACILWLLMMLNANKVQARCQMPNRRRDSSVYFHAFKT